MLVLLKVAMVNCLIPCFLWLLTTSDEPSLRMCVYIYITQNREITYRFWVLLKHVDFHEFSKTKSETLSSLNLVIFTIKFYMHIFVHYIYINSNINSINIYT